MTVDQATPHHAKPSKLFNFDIDWKLVIDSKILENKVKDFVAKHIKELMGEVKLNIKNN